MNCQMFSTGLSSGDFGVLQKAHLTPWFVRGVGLGGHRGKAPLPEHITQARENRRGVAHGGRQRVNDR
jgi:hypothetical protein